MVRETVVYYELKKVVIDPVKPGEFRLASAACVTCSTCGGYIDGMGGPGNAPVCVRCAEVLRNGKARGAIVWSDGEDTSANHKDTPDA